MSSVRFNRCSPPLARRLLRRQHRNADSLDVRVDCSLANASATSVVQASRSDTGEESYARETCSARCPEEITDAVLR